MTDTADLMARMLTCATAVTIATTNRPAADEQTPITFDTDKLMVDAASLLIEAAAALEKLAPPTAPEPPGEPMAILEPLPPARGVFPDQGSVMDPGPPATVPPRVGSRACPQCGSHAAKRSTFAPNNQIVLTCPVCLHRWFWRAPAAEWK